MRKSLLSQTTVRIVTTFIGVAAVQTPQKGFAISRVGNRTLQDSRSEALVEVSKVFIGVSEISASRIRLQGIGLRPNIGEARDFLTEYPEWKELSRADFKAKMQELEWVQNLLPIVLNSCVEVYSGEAENTLTTFATWGNGSGYVFIVPSTAQNRRALLETISTLQITGDPCLWKIPPTP